MLPQYGYALVEEELSKRELDDEILSKENEILQQRFKEEELNNNSEDKDRHENGDVNSNHLDTNNNTVKKRNKSALNLEVESCPGLAMSAVTYKMD